MMNKKGPKLQGTTGEKATGLIVVGASRDWTKPLLGLILIDPVRFWWRWSLPFGVNYLCSLESHGRPDRAWWVGKPGLGRMEKIALPFYNSTSTSKCRLHCRSTMSSKPPRQGGSWLPQNILREPVPSVGFSRLWTMLTCLDPTNQILRTSHQSAGSSDLPSLV